MTTQQNISSYLCHVVGETPQRAAVLHASTVRRTKAFAIAIHIPVLLWAVTGFVISSQIFHQSDAVAASVAFFCASLIYLVERLVLATPKIWCVHVSRAFIGLVISILGASAVDLVIFEREISEQLLLSGEATLLAEHDALLVTHAQAVAQKKADWFKAQDAANCEANGTCGSKLRSVGPVYQELARQAELLRQEYMSAQNQLAIATQGKAQALAGWRAAPPTGDKAGLLARVQALHEYTTHNTVALVAWFLFFLLVLFFEMMVVLSKLVFSDTVDDELDSIRERISQQKARDYLEAITSPVAEAQALVTASYS
jgi:hypothetical protein